MNRDRIEGKGKEALGGAQQTAGDVAGDRGRPGWGATQRTGGKAQGGLGGLMDNVRGLLKR